MFTVCSWLNRQMQYGGPTKGLEHPWSLVSEGGPGTNPTTTPGLPGMTICCHLDTSDGGDESTLLVHPK